MTDEDAGVGEDVRAVSCTSRTAERHRVTLRVERGTAYPMGGSGHPRPHLLAESVRRAGIAVARSGLGVPDEFRVALQELWFDRDPAATPVDTDCLTAEVACSSVERRGPHVTGFVYAVRLPDSSRDRARGGGKLRFLSPSVYRFVRAQQQDALTETAEAPFRRDRLVARTLVGLGSAADVLLAECPAPLKLPGRDGRTWLIEPDPARLGESADHVPGAVLVAAAGQAALAAGELTAVTGASASFLRHAELTAVLRISVDEDAPPTPGAVSATVRQGEEVVCRVRVTGDQK